MLKPIFGISFGNFPIYRFFLCLAFLIGFFVLKRAIKNGGFSKNIKGRIYKSFFISTFFAVVGANVSTWIFSKSALDYSFVTHLLDSGFSFYFGMLTFFASALIFLRIYQTDAKRYINLFVPPILIMQFIARMGCSLRGCCFGKTFSLFGAEFLIPVRELESIFALVLFIVLSASKNASKKRLPIYLFSYSIFRFITEFFRGDETEGLWGITALPPIQIASIIVILISGFYLFAPSKLKTAVCEFFKNIKAKILPKSAQTTYIPLVDKHTPPKKQHRYRFIKVLAIILSITTVISATFIIYVNPSNAEWRENLSNSISSALAPLVENKTIETEIGKTNAVSLLDVSDKGVIESPEKAAQIVESYSTVTDIEYVCSVTEQLDNGNNLYVLNQSVKGIPIFGKSQILVADSQNNALYLAGDSATIAINTTITKVSCTDDKNDVKILGDKIKLANKKEYWYESSEGLVKAYLADLTVDGKETAYNALVEKATNNIITYTTDSNVVSTLEGANIITAAENVATLMQEENNKSIKEICKSKKKDIATDKQLIEKSLCDAFKKSGLEHKDFEVAINSANEISKNLPDLNKEVYKEIICCEAIKTLTNNGVSVKDAEKYAKKIKKAFKKNGIKATIDECLTDVTINNIDNSFEHEINHSADVDMFDVLGIPGDEIEITVETEKPIYISVYTEQGTEVTSIFTEKEQSVTLYPQDGSNYSVKISGLHYSTDIFEPYNYEIKYATVHNEYVAPKYISEILHDIQRAYNNSNAASFATIYTSGSDVDIQKTLTTSLFFPLDDACAVCSGMEDIYDSSKNLMILYLIPKSQYFDEMYHTANTTIELSLFDYEIIEDATYVMANLTLYYDKSIKVFEGYTYLKIEYSENETELDDFTKTMALIFSLRYGKNYYVTDINTPETLKQFEDVTDKNSPKYGLQSLYAYVTTEVVPYEAIYYTKYTINEELVPEEYKELLPSFRKYLKAQTLCQVKMDLMSCNFEWATNTIVSDITTVVSAVSAINGICSAVTTSEMTDIIIQEVTSDKLDSFNPIDNAAEDARRKVISYNKLLKELDPDRAN